MIYLNSWQFVELNDKKFGLSFTENTILALQMEEKLDRFLKFVEENDLAITRMKDFFSKIQLKKRKDLHPFYTD